MSNTTTPTLPPSLDLPPHLSAQKYFFVCTLTVLAWDALVLTPRSYRLGRLPKWPALKFMYYFMQFWVLADFVVTGAFPSLSPPYRETSGVNLKRGYRCNVL